MSAYYHPTKHHSAISIGKNGEKSILSPAGVWAVSI